MSRYSSRKQEEFYQPCRIFLVEDRSYQRWGRWGRYWAVVKINMATNEPEEVFYKDK